MSVSDARVKRTFSIEILAAIICFLLLTIDLTQLKIVRTDQQFGDTAQLSEVIENISSRGTPANQIMPGLLTFLAQHVPTLHAAQYATAPLAPPAVYEQNHLQFHAYLILYPIALLARVFTVNGVLMALYVLSFTGPLLLLYLALRRWGIHIAATVLFCLLIVCHPAWSEGLRGQFYPDRLFILFGLMLMLTATSRTPKRVLLAVSALLCLSIDERGAITAGLFLVAYTVLYWTINRCDRFVRLGLGIALIGYGVIAVKYFLPNNIYDGSFLPTSWIDLYGRFTMAWFTHDVLIFLLVNASLLVVALFDVRAALIALFLMLPNIVGTLGGAEKVGWSTHYQDEYLPALIWAALLGFVKAYATWPRIRYRAALLGGVALVIVFLALLNPYDGTFGRANIDNQFVFWYPRESKAFNTPEARAATIWTQQLAQAVPEHSVVTTVETAMPFLYHDRSLQLFPIDLDHADYAVLVATGTGPATIYTGVTDFWGPQDTLAANEVVVTRMKRDGYDFAHPVYTAPNGLTVIRRIPRTS
jgi:hypothetical protein